MMGKIQRMDYQIVSQIGRNNDELPVDSEIESLVLETRAPRDLVRNLYTSERAKLERTAKIKTYVPVLIRRRVKAMLQEQRHA
jgi:Protein of unknown function (DUF3562)